jgi:transposase InsO family protein
MRKRRRRIWELDIGKKIFSPHAKIDGFYQLIHQTVDFMQTKAENKLNPFKHPLSDEAKKRLKWMYIIHFECGGRIAKAARKINISRQWLSKLHSAWDGADKDPRALEPESRAPRNTDRRKRIAWQAENKIIEVRNKYRWGKDKLATVLRRDHGIRIGSSTVNRYLGKHGLLDVKISRRIKTAHQDKLIEQKQKCRPPREIKDYKPGALIEKDMKFIVKAGIFIDPNKYKAKENFWYQQTLIDSFTRIRALGLAEDGESKTAVAVQEECEKRFPFPIACANTDNGSENEKDFDDYLERNKIVHFYSRSGTPTDNPRVERSHLTDELEFYRQGNVCRTLAEQKQRLADWEYEYNRVRPHQALGNLTPMEFYELWKINPDEAYAIAEKWKNYLKKQSRRLANSRKMRNREKITKLMEQIDKKLINSYK